MKFSESVCSKVNIRILFFSIFFMVSESVTSQTKPINQFDADLEDFFTYATSFMHYSDVDLKNIIATTRKNIKIRSSALSKFNEGEDFEFIEDTISIRAYYMIIIEGSSTQEQNEGFIFYNNAYDLLLNKYYKLALGILSEEYKKQLVISQRRWLDYYIKEKDFLFDLYSTGLANSQLYIWPNVNEIIEQRVNTLHYIYLGINNNERAFKD